ncbi:phage minor capsid protein [Bacillus spizizenii]|nr:phage minor capsid protein [Bacillus spizizenii]MCY8907086.1 phage minor capsid protein [Bacillus spizizenii]
MRITPERAEQIAWPIVQLYSSIQTEILESIASLLADNQEALEDDANAWYVDKLEQIGGLTRENVKILSRNSGLRTKLINQILKDSGFEGIETNEIMLEKAVKQNLIPAALPAREDPAIWRILDAFEKQASDTFNLINSTMLRESEEVYRDILTRSTADVLSGMKTPKQALRSTVKEWAQKGIPVLKTANGGRRYAEGYAYTVIRTVSHNVTNEMQEARFDTYGIELVEVSSHSGARPKCAPYQGRIYSRNGRHPNYPPLSSTSIGDPAGLFGINCGHYQYAYIPGMSERRYKPMNAERNEQAYQNSQKQRALERSIRNNKRELAALEKMNDEEGAKMAKRKVLDSQARLRSFIAKTGRTRRREREQIYN